MEYVSFEETIGVYDGDQSVVDSCLSYVYELQKTCPESDGNSNYGGWQKDIDHPIKEVILREFKQYMKHYICLLYTSPSPRDLVISRMPSSA